ncbi:YihY/virulence factor BrkB family protein [Streptomyces bobili]|uniref:YihY/virulence factor BrkB family protein n=1 Tax=Streptomyces bobili TaxID=67280 RepID=UPI0033B78ADA
MEAVQRVDAFQRRHRWLGLPLAVVYKFIDDQGMYLAALIAYYGFLSLFPLLLLLVSALAVLLENNPTLRDQVLDSALRNFPVLGDQLRQNIHSFQANGFALAAGVIGSIYGALGVAQAAQHALNKIWAVPRHARPNPVLARLKGLLFMAVLAVGLVATTALSTAATATRVFGVHVGAGSRLGVIIFVILLNAAMLLLCLRILTHTELPLRRLWVTAIGGACAWQALQWGGAFYVRHFLNGASATYGMFGIVLGLLASLYLSALVFVLTAETGAVRVHRLWPRSLLAPFTDRTRLSQADRRAYRSYAAAQSFKGFQKISVEFRRGPEAETDGIGSTGTNDSGADRWIDDGHLDRGA